MEGRGGRITGTATEKQVEAYATVNRFLSGFIDHVSIPLYNIQGSEAMGYTCIRYIKCVCQKLYFHM